MTNNNQPKTVTTAEAAKILGVRADTVHVMKVNGKLTPVGKNRARANLFAEAEVLALAAKRKARRVPEQQQLLPDSAVPACKECAGWRARALAAEDRVQRVQAAMSAAVAAALGG